MKAKNSEGQRLGNFDALYQFSFGACVLEWETGNVSSSHRSLNKMAMLVSKGIIAIGPHSSFEGLISLFDR